MPLRHAEYGHIRPTCLLSLPWPTWQINMVMREVPPRAHFVLAGDTNMRVKENAAGAPAFMPVQRLAGLAGCVHVNDGVVATWLVRMP